MAFVGPEDEPRLAKEFARYKTGRQKEREERLAEITNASAKEIGASIHGSQAKRTASDEEAAKWREEQRSWVMRSYEVLNLTPEDAKAGKGGIRDAYLRKQWADQHGYDLRQLKRAERVFERWLATHLVNRQINIINQGRIEQDLFLSPTEWEGWKAAVTCAIEFEDGALVYLTGFDLRQHLRPEEWNDIAKLTGISDGTEATELEVKAQIQGLNQTVTAAAAELSGKFTQTQELLKKLFTDRGEADNRASQQHEESQSRQRRYSFSRTGRKIWTVGFPPHTPFQVADSGAGDRLKYVLEHPNERFDPLSLAGLLSAGTGVARQITESEQLDTGLVDATARKTRKGITEFEYRKLKAALEQAILEAEEEGRFEDKDEKINHLRKLEHLWSKTDKDDLRREYKRLHAALQRLKDIARKSHTKGGQAFAEHLDTHLRWMGYRLEYTPPEDVQWNP